MATLKGNIDFTGSMGGMSAYKRRDLDKTILRGKGGANKKKIYTAASFKLTRQNFTEFGLCGKMGGCIRRSMIALASLADYNFTPRLTSLAKSIQKLDKENDRGERSILLSAHKYLLPGFSLNKRIAFESIVKAPLQWQINREEKAAVIQIPELVPSINFVSYRSYPFYRFIINMAAVKDKTFATEPLNRTEDSDSKALFGPWRSSNQTVPADELKVQLSIKELDEQTTFILSVGIQFGVSVTDALIQPAKYAGCAKIIAVG